MAGLRLLLDVHRLDSAGGRRGRARTAPPATTAEVSVETNDARGSTAWSPCTRPAATGGSRPRRRRGRSWGIAVRHRSPTSRSASSSSRSTAPATSPLRQQGPRLRPDPATTCRTGDHPFPRGTRSGWFTAAPRSRSIRPSTPTSRSTASARSRTRAVHSDRAGQRHPRPRCRYGQRRHGHVIVASTAPHPRSRPRRGRRRSKRVAQQYLSQRSLRVPMPRPA